VSSSATALLLAALCAAAPAAVAPAKGSDALALAKDMTDDSVAYLAIPFPIDLVEQALPPPPVTVVIKTSYYGTVTVDHKAHLARQIHCKSCHGPGPVKRIEFTAKLAHERCRSCHSEQKKGPTDCRGCHVMPPKGSETVTAEVAPPSGPPGRGGEAVASATGAAGGTASGTPAGSLVVATSVTPAAPFVPFSGTAAGSVTAYSWVPTEDQELRRTIQFGGIAGSGYGVSAHVSSRQGAMVLTHGIDRLGGNGPTRTLVMVGAGAQLPFNLPSTLGILAEGIGGVDAVERPSVDVMPAVGARLGLEWTPRWSRQAPFILAVTGLVDLFHSGLATPACLYATIGVGAPLQRRAPGAAGLP